MLQNWRLKNYYKHEAGKVKPVGVLAIQGDFEKHKQMLLRLGREVVEVRTAEQLFNTDALIIPGGESTTLVKFFQEFNMDKSIRQYAVSHPVMGTCAGLIVLAKTVDNMAVNSLGLIDIEVKRNAYGRQKESFVDQIQINLNGAPSTFTGVFIRAPKISRYGKNIKILGKHSDDVVMAAADNILVCTFHPELTDDTRIHNYFLKIFLNE
jgi:5'-phosphate synthase pdxT subunit